MATQFVGNSATTLEAMSPGFGPTSRQSEFEELKSQLGLDQAMVELMRLSDIDAKSGQQVQAVTSFKM